MDNDVPSFGFSMELSNANNNGCNFVAGPLTRAIVVTGFQIGNSVGFIANPAPGTFVEGIVTGFFVAAMPTFTEPQGGGGGSLTCLLPKSAS